ncbi:hypothetical protein [Segniliparus rugosus]|uniref:hypothetical protein n=1 Tax=Segniliparus rugosus TaxID=286804 RepID=UPI0002F70576|nr:hypothetical protein [Segniliparus rugosus]
MLAEVSEIGEPVAELVPKAVRNLQEAESMTEPWAQIRAELSGLGESLAGSASRADTASVLVETWSEEKGFHKAPMRTSPFLPVEKDLPGCWIDAEPPVCASARYAGDSPAAVAYGLEFNLTERWCPTGLPDHSLFLGEAWFQRSHPRPCDGSFVAENAVAVLYQELPGEDVVAERAWQVRSALAAHLEDPGVRVREIPLRGTGPCPSLGYTRTKSARFLDSRTSQWQSVRDRSFESYTRVGGLLLVVSVTSHERNQPAGAMSNKDMNCLMECLTAITVARIEGRY